MPNFKTFHNYKSIYSVDMMLCYINTHGHKKQKLLVEDFVPQLKEKGWGQWSLMDVIEKMHLKKYKEDAERIKKANLEYPIIVTGNHSIVDGYHRIAKAYLEKKKHIDAYVFDSELMNKFILSKDMNFIKVHTDTEIHTLLELWTKRFCK
jgi:disulfide oxidoreductase YuzD